MASQIIVSFALAAGIALPIGALTETNQTPMSEFKASTCEISTASGKTTVPCSVNQETGAKLGVG